MDQICVLWVGWNCHGMYLWVPVTAPQRNPALPLLDFQFNAKWDRWSPKLQLRWSFPQICLRTVASWTQQLDTFSPPIVLIVPRPTPKGIMHEMLALAHDGMRKSAVAGRRVWLLLLSTASSGGMLPLELWCQVSRQGLRRPHLIKTVLCWEWCDSIAS